MVGWRSPGSDLDRTAARNIEGKSWLTEIYQEASAIRRPYDDIGAQVTFGGLGGSRP